jgi:Protein of unknown function (DUF3558)
MRSVIVTPIAGLAVLLAAVTGCSSPSVGGEPSADAGSGGSAAPSSAGGAAAVPLVPHALDPAKYIADPCSVLTSDQLAKFGMSGSGDADTTSSLAKYAGPRCAWMNRESHTGIVVAFTAGNRNGLADLYRGDSQGQFGYFEPITVDGYPGVLADLTDTRKTGTCNANVAVNEKLTFLAKKFNGDGPRSCADAQRLAAEVLRTLKGDG